MDESYLVIGFHGIIALIWFAFGTVGLQTGNMGQGGIGFIGGIALLAVGLFVGSRYSENETKAVTEPGTNAN